MLNGHSAACFCNPLSSRGDGSSTGGGSCSGKEPGIQPTSAKKVEKRTRAHERVNVAICDVAGWQQRKVRQKMNKKQKHLLLGSEMPAA